MGLTHTTLTGPLSKREQASTAATANAIVLPDPVTASATTSFCVSNSGSAAAWTGVMLEKRKSLWRQVSVALLSSGRRAAKDCAIAAAARLLSPAAVLTLALQGDRAHHSVRAPTGLAGSVLQDSHTFLNARNSSEQAGLAALQLKQSLLVCYRR